MVSSPLFKIFTVLYLTIKLEKSNSSRKKFTNSAISHPNGETDLHTVPDMPAGAGGPRRWHLKKADSECPPDGPPLPESPPAADLRLEGLQLPGGGAGEEEQGDQKLSFDKLVINLDSYELLVDGKRVDTPPKELELLYHLAASPNRVFTRNQLLDEVWGFDYFGDSRTVDVHIKRLREKLEGVSDQWSLKTVWGVGYKFEVKK